MINLDRTLVNESGNVLFFLPASRGESLALLCDCVFFKPGDSKTSGFPPVCPGDALVELESVLKKIISKAAKKVP